MPRPLNPTSAIMFSAGACSRWQALRSVALPIAQCTVAAPVAQQPAVEVEADRAAVLREAADMTEQTFIHGVTPAASERGLGNQAPAQMAPHAERRPARQHLIGFGHELAGLLTLAGQACRDGVSVTDQPAIDRQDRHHRRIHTVKDRVSGPARRRVQQ